MLCARSKSKSAILWVTCENAHPAIVDKETFETAKRLRQGRRRLNKSGATGVLNGLLVCGDCGGKLHLKRQIKKDVEYCYFECRNARNRNENITCTCHAVKREPLEQLVLEEIQQIVQCAKSSEGKLMEKLRASECQERRQALKTAETEFAKTKQRIAELDRIISKIYEDNVTGKLSVERFSIMLAGFEAEQSELKARAAEYEGVLRAENAQSENVHRFLNLVRRFTEPTELTAELAREFIEKIVIGRAEHIGVGHHTKRQKVKIVYNHIGEGSDTVMETSRN